MLILAPDEALYFLHIPKTAGMTMTHLLDNQFHLDDIFPGQFLADILTNPEAIPNIDRYRLYRGHFNQALLTLVKRPLQTITVLRDPIARTVSGIDHALRLDYAGQNITFEQLLEDPRYRITQTDVQTFCVISDLAWFDHVLPDEDSEIVNERKLYMARQRLDSCLVVGIQERFEETLLLLAYTLGIAIPRQNTKYNVSGRKTRPEDLSAETLEQLHNINALDKQLYDHALNLFDQKLSAMRQHLNTLFPELTHDPYSQIERYNLQREKASKKASTANSLAEDNQPVRYRFDQKLNGTGWHQREMREQDVVRWTGPEDEAQLRLLLPTTNPVNVKVVVTDFVNQTAKSQFRLKVNDHDIPLRLETEQGLLVYRGTVLQNALKTEEKYAEQRISLCVPASPLAERSAGDPRLAGASVAGVEFIPLSPAQQSLEAMTILFQDEMFGQNWYAAEPFEDQAARWTGPGETATLYLAMDARRDYELRLETLGFASEDALRSFSLRANTTDIPLEMQSVPETPRLIFTGKIPKAALLLGPEAQLFQFTVTQPTPITGPDGSIERIVGARLVSMTLQPVKANTAEAAFSFLKDALKTRS
jgi:hypothetical protein